MFLDFRSLACSSVFLLCEQWESLFVIERDCKQTRTPMTVKSSVANQRHLTESAVRCCILFSAAANSFPLSRCLFPRQALLDFRDPLMVSLDFGLAEEDQGPVLDESLPRSINQTVRLPRLLTTRRYSLNTSHCQIATHVSEPRRGQRFRLLPSALALVCNS